MKTYGLIGFPLSHSFSQKYFTEKFKIENIPDCEFRNFLLDDINKFPELIKSTPSLCGLSITIPHKQNVIKFLDVVDASAKEIGAVNCIKRWQMADGGWRMAGYNTDIFGFEKSLIPLLKSYHTHALILGTGGAAKAVVYVLDKLKIKFRYVSRTINHLSYTEINQKIIQENLLIINATPLGMFPNINNYPNIPYKFLSSAHLLYDLTYNPEETLFLKKGKENGAQAKNGLEMLHLQAEKSWEIWNSPS
ncbi:MAG: shikimate dehydrogenase [Bacteroidetes bacterium]|nr:shikimate dehydrogenase [Bacteroidota bacterium]